MSKLNRVRKNPFPTKRLVTNAILIAMYFALSQISVRIGETYKITFVSLPVVISAVLCGPADAFLVGILGGFLEQLLSQYGLTATTVLWILPEAIRGLFIGGAVCLFRLSADSIGKRSLTTFFAVCLIAAPLTSTLNTLVLCLDSKMFGYYSYAMVWGAFWLRLLFGTLSALMTAIAAVSVITALKHITPQRRTE